MHTCLRAGMHACIYPCAHSCMHACMFGMLVCALGTFESACWLLQAMEGSGELWMALDGVGRLVEGFFNAFEGSGMLLEGFRKASGRFWKALEGQTDAHRSPTQTHPKRYAHLGLGDTCAPNHMNYSRFCNSDISCMRAKPWKSQHDSRGAHPTRPDT